MVETGLGLRYYIELLLRERRWIILWITVACVGSIALTLLLPQVYKAEATVAILRSRTQVEFDPRITALDDYEFARSDLESRRESLTALLGSNVVVAAVLQDVGDHLPANDRELSTLRDMLTIQASGDLININVQHSDPDLATEIANSWAQNYEAYVNSLYLGRAELGTTSTTEQLDEAYASYQSAQSELEAFLRESNIASLTSELERNEILFDGLHQTLVGIQVSPITNTHKLLSSYYSELRKIDNSLANANALFEQTQADANSTAANLGNLVALVRLRSEVFSATSEEQIAPTTLQFDLGNLPNEQVSPGDVEALIQILEARRSAAEERISTLENTIDQNLIVQPDDEESTLRAQIASFSQAIGSLSSEIERQNAMLRELEQERDRHWETYQALHAKLVEESITLNSTDAEVQVADSAIVPSTPESRGLLRNIVLAALMAGMVSVTTIVFSDWWDSTERSRAAAELPERRESEEVSPREVVDMVPASSRSSQS